MNHLERKLKRRLAQLAGPVLMLSAPLSLADVELVPGHITGNVSIGTDTIVYVNVRAINADGQAQQALYPNMQSAPYDLTVNVPSGGSATYSVQAQNVRTRDAVASPWDNDYLTFPSQSVSVSESTPATADFELLAPNHVEGNVTLTGSGQLHYMYVFAYPVTNNGFSHYTQQQADNSTRNALTFEFPVSNGDMRCTGTAYLTDGTRITLPQQVLSPVGGVVTCDWEIATPETGQIGGSIEFQGLDPVDRFYVYTSGPTSRNWNANSPDNPDDYLLPDLSLGSYNLYSYAYLNSYDDQFYFPHAAFSPARSTQIAAGDSDAIDIFACQSYIAGTLSLSGAVGWDDINYGDISVSGVFQGGQPNGGPSSGGAARDVFSTADGSYDLIVSPGDWYSNYIYLRPYNSDSSNYLSEALYIYDRSVMPANNPASPPSCGSQVDQDMAYSMGEVTVNFSVAGGDTMSDPRLSGYCYEYDENGTLLYYYRFDSTNSVQDNVTTGHATFVGPEADCTDVMAEAYVGGTRTTFGEIDIEVIGGGEVVIDIGGPGLTLVEPEANLCLDAQETTVLGTATDDVGVASVSVNGVSADLSPPGGEGTLSTDFSATIALTPGANTVETIATDTSGKIGSDTRTIYRDAGPPVLDWLPLNGTTTPLLSIDVEGIVRDDVDVDSLTVNGTLAALSPTANPGEYTFSVPVGLAVGSNMITVSVTEATGCEEVVEVREVTVVENQPPTADAGGPYSVDEGASIGLDGSASDDPDDDPLTFEWDLDYNGSTFDVDSSGSATPTFSAASLDGPNVVTVAVRVTDTEGESAVDTAEVTINNVAPSANLLASDSVDEGDDISVALSDGFDASPADLSAGLEFAFDCGAGYGSFSVVANTTCPTSDNGTVAVRAKVRDKDGGESEYSADVTVLNVAPDLGAISVIGELVPIGTQISASADFTDPGSADTHTATWNWGDGSGPGTVTESGGNGTVDDAHTYTAPGVYTVTLTVEDDDGGSDTATWQYVVVYDPDGSFVTGGGTIDSPPGAYLAAPDLTGVANFGFVSKYKKGATVPDGHTEFQFHAAGMDFKSTDYQWLVVSGARAQFKGQGTIQHTEGSFGFMLTAIDGDVNGGGGMDKFRIKIWDANDDSNVIYDNEVGATDDVDPATALRSGSIVIHSKGKK